MILYFLAFLGGVLTIVSPCILPVLPFVFSRADQPFRRSGLPLLAGMALSFIVGRRGDGCGGMDCPNESDWPWAGHCGLPLPSVFPSYFLESQSLFRDRSCGSAESSQYQERGHRAPASRCCWEFQQDCFGRPAQARFWV